MHKTGRPLSSRVIVSVIALAMLVNAGALAPVEQARAAPPVFVPDPPPAPALPPDLAEVLSSEAANLPELSAPITPNHVDQLTPTQVEEFESATGSTVVDNMDGLLTFDTRETGELVRVAVFDAHTSSGLDVIGFTFLTEDDIAELEAMRAESGGLGFGPQVASAHVAPFNHYHYFWKCSYVLQYANSWNLAVYVCPTDVGLIRAVGSAVAGAIGLALKHPVLALLGVLVVNIAIWFFQSPDGAIRLYVPGGAVSASYGSTYYYGPAEGWWYHYSQSSSLYCYARRQSTGYLYYEC
jgi:hypothetical protein